jgi:hypothetical protein
MGKILKSFYDNLSVIERIDLSKKTKISSMKAEDLEDSKENIELFENTLKEIKNGKKKTHN